VLLPLGQIGKMGFRDGTVRPSTEESVEADQFGNHQLEVPPTRCCGEYLESLEIKFRWFTQAPKGEL